MADEQIPDNPAQDAAANPDPNVDLAKRLQEVEQRYAASSRESLRLAQENQLLKGQVASFVQPPTQANDPYTDLETIGVPTRSLREVVRREAQEMVKPVIDLISGSVASRNHMLAHYGQDYVKFEGDVMAHLESDPELNARYQKMFAADPVGAGEWAFDRFGEHKRKTSTPDPEAGKSARDAEVSQARVPSSRQSEGRRSESARNPRVQMLWDRYQHNPNRSNADAFLMARLGQSIPDEHLTG